MGYTAFHAQLAPAEIVYQEAKPLIKATEESRIRGDLGINVVSQYVSRGLILENQGAIIQPYADLYFKLYAGEGFLNQVQINLGIWNSFHGEKTRMPARSPAAPPRFPPGMSAILPQESPSLLASTGPSLQATSPS